MAFPDNRHLTDIIKKHAGQMDPVETGLEPDFFRTGNTRAVLFDIYGTLFISEAGDISHAKSSSASSDIFSMALSEAGIDTEAIGENILKHLPSAYIAEIKNEHMRLKNRGIEYPEVVITEIWDKILKKLTGISFGEEIIKTAAAAYEAVSNRTCPMPGTEKLILYLKKKGIITGMISNAQFYTPLLFEAWFGKSCEKLGFDRDLSIYSYLYRRGKPDSFLFRKAVDILWKKYQIKPEEVLYTGNDMLNDITAASHTGMKTLLFAGDMRSLRLRKENPECRGIFPDMVITKLGQIRDIID